MKKFFRILSLMFILMFSVLLSGCCEDESNTGFTNTKNNSHNSSECVSMMEFLDKPLEEQIEIVYYVTYKIDSWHFAKMTRSMTYYNWEYYTVGDCSRSIKNRDCFEEGTSDDYIAFQTKVSNLEVYVLEHHDELKEKYNVDK